MSFPLPDSVNGAASPAKAVVGNKPVFDYIASLSEPHRSIASAVDALAAAAVPGLQPSAKRASRREESRSLRPSSSTRLSSPRG